MSLLAVKWHIYQPRDWATEHFQDLPCKSGMIDIYLLAWESFGGHDIIFLFKKIERKITTWPILCHVVIFLSIFLNCFMACVALHELLQCSFG